MPLVHPTVRARWCWAHAAVLLLLGITLHAAQAARAQNGEGAVFLIQVRGEIDLGLAPFLARVIDQAQRENARAVILEIDTPGGRLDAVLQMRDAILGSTVRTIAFVNRTAFSAGALVALSANEVYMAPGAVVGAATPVTGAGEAADEKVISAVRTTFRSTAELRGRNPRVAEAMVDPAVEIEGLVSGTQLLTMTTNEALTWGYAEGVAENRGALLEAAGLEGATIQEVSPTWAEHVVRFLTNPLIASLLISAGFLLIVVDLLGGGIGISSGIGVGLLAIFFWGHMLVGLAGWEGVALVLLGLALLGLEVFVIPGFGIAGIAGLAAVSAGLFLSLVGREIVTEADLVRAASTLGLALLVTVAGGALLFWRLPRATRFGGLILRSRLGVVDAPSSAPHGSGRTHLPPSGRATAPAERPSLIGARGLTESDLRPGGFARIKGARVDVVSEGNFIPAGEPIEVISDEGYRRVVRRLGEAEVDPRNARPRTG